MSSIYKVASLFCGCGGIDMGLEGGFKLPYQNKGEAIEKLRFEVVWANDFNPKAVDSYNLNFPDHYSICGNIVKVVKKAAKLRKKQQGEDIGSVEVPIDQACGFHSKHGKFFFPGKVDVVTGGFPCQPFSLAGKRKGLRDKRGKLYEAMLEAVDMLRPKLFIAENVAGLLSAKVGTKDVIDKIKDDFSEIGYDLNWELLTASNFGIPQRRERVIMVGVLEGSPRFDFNTIGYFEYIKQTVTLGEGIGGLKDKPWNPKTMHVWSRARLNRGQGNVNCLKDEPAPTMRAEHHGNIEFHYDALESEEFLAGNGRRTRPIRTPDNRIKKTRRLSVREAALIQSFPMDFNFSGSATDAYRQIGNAVPPLLAWHIGRAVQSYLDSLESKVSSNGKISNV
jgi:DNA (cytosine-5)-methyltransferase 1